MVWANLKTHIMEQMTIKGDKKKIDRLRKELKHRLRKDNLVLKGKTVKKEIEEVIEKPIEEVIEETPVVEKEKKTGLFTRTKKK